MQNRKCADCAHDYDIVIGPTADEVFTFSNEKEFYKKLQVILPDLVVLDVMLPDESGNEIIKNFVVRQKQEEFL